MKDYAKEIKSLVSKMKEGLEKDSEQFPLYIRELEDYQAACLDSAAVSVLHSMIAEMYNNYYQQNRWKIDQRTALSGYVPEDVREWSTNLFKEQIKKELDASLADEQLLVNIPVEKFQTLLEKKEKGEYLYPTLFDFLSQRATQIQPEAAYYENWLHSLQIRPGLDRAVLLAELSYLNYQNDNRPFNRRTFTEYNEKLDSLLTHYSDRDYSNEIRIAQIESLDRYGFPGMNEDSVRTLKLKIATIGITLFPQYERTVSLQNTLNGLQAPFLSLSTNSNVYPGDELQVKLKYRNIAEITFSIYQSNKAPTDLNRYQPNNQKLNVGKLVKQVTIQLKPRTSYLEEDTVITTRIQTPGIYECVVNTKGCERTQTTFTVSRLASAYRTTPTGRGSLFVTDYKTGKPVEKANVLLYRTEKGKLTQASTLQTNENGIVILGDDEQMNYYRVTYEKDTSPFVSPLYNYYSRTNEAAEDRTNVYLLTDRSIYRPGQTVFFKGIAVQQKDGTPQLIAGKPFEVTLTDANGQTVLTKNFTSNPFGSFNGEFTLPMGTLNGTFSLTTPDGSASIRVEEYKRPSFRIELDPVKEQTSFGDPLTLKGAASTFSGVPLNEGTVEYRIIKRPMLLRGYFPDYSEEQVGEGTAPIDRNGCFTIPFTPVNEDERRTPFPLFNNYEVIARLTDTKGEAQEQSMTFAVGETGFLLAADLPDKIVKDKAKIVVTAQTANGEKLDGIEGTYKMYTLTGRKPADYKEGSSLAEGNFTAGKPIDTKMFALLPSGNYRIKFETKDTQGRLVTSQNDLILYKPDDEKPPVYTHFWTVQNKVECIPGQSTTFKLGTSDKAYILYEIFSAKGTLKREIVKLNNEIKNFEYTYPKDAPDGLVATFTFINEGELHSTQLALEPKQPDRALTIKPLTFRDRLLPGSKEEWRFKVAGSDSAGVAAEVLAGLYDASLDKLQPFNWYFDPVRRATLSIPSFRGSQSFGTQSNSAYSNNDKLYKDVLPYLFYQLDWQDVLNNYGGLTVQSFGARSGGLMMSKSSRIADDNMPQEEALTESAVASADVKAPAPQAAPSRQPAPQLRQNFNETAFFFPNLVTNKAGEVIIRFTLPESNTTWKLQTLAHTTDLKYGTYTDEVVSQKPFMLSPNLPRFLRAGDLVTLSAQLQNQSGKTVSGNAWVEFFDPVTDRAINGLAKEEKTFRVDSMQVEAIQWTIKVPEGLELIGCRVMADSKAGSDGEQHLLPVLSNQTLVTTTRPFYITKEGKTKIAEPTARPVHRLTFELTSNPIWYAVQALPTLSEPADNNILSWFASYYSNTLASAVFAKDSTLRRTIETWKKQGGTVETLLSNLQKNEELKNILLQETPWLMEAYSETEQKQRLTLLFDMNRSEQQQAAARRQLIDRQLPDGSWNWYEGFTGDPAITLRILQGMAQLVEMNAIEYNQEEREMQIRALQYLDQMITDDHQKATKFLSKTKGKLSDIQLQYLYTRSAYRDIPSGQDTNKAIQYYTDIARKEWEEASLYKKAEIALLMHRNGDKETSATILAWLRKNSRTETNRGMYWPNNRQSSAFFFSPIDVHCLLLSAFNQIDPVTKEIEDLKQWLLTHKRTQDWSTETGTVNAIHALLTTGKDWLDEDNECVVRWGKNSFDTAKGEVGTGYFMIQSDDPEEIKEMRIIEIEKNGEAPAWGALYSQQLEPIASTVRQGDDLQIDRKLFLEKVTGEGKTLVPLTEGESLHVGDRAVVRLTIRSNAALSYVHLKDLRAGCFEPTEQISRTGYQDGLPFYRSPKDASENFFISALPIGTFVLEYPVEVSRAGTYAGSISTLQCLYAPEYVANSEGSRITVKP